MQALFNGLQISEERRSLIALPCELGSIINPVEIANEEYVNSREITKKLTSSINKLAQLHSIRR